ncbi:hypothetical protein ACIP5Y_07875 [Nocardia sp. NPDC088792]|uniref:hypothetical protein n=1 Tax=Nocardia sp. NPDC088792 TaxID=3364332 RepID=UPI0037FA3ECA
MTPYTVDHAALVLGRRLGQGGQGIVHEVTNRKITVGNGPGWPVVFKEYDAALRPQLDTAALAAMVTMLFELTATEGEWLCERAAWPAAIVEREGRVCGFLMRAVPDRFRFDLQSLSGTATATRRLANVEYLLNDDTYSAGIGLAITDADRLALLTELAGILTRLHRLGIVVGDLSPKNLLFSTTPDAACFLLDCDAMRLHGNSVLPQAETPDWQLPSGEEKATAFGDVYKFGLLAVRLFDRSQTTTDPTALAATSTALGDLARASLSPESARRPSPGWWTEMLSAARPTVVVALPVSSAGPGPAPRAAGPQPATVGSGQPSEAAKSIMLGLAVVVIIALIVVLAMVGSHSAHHSSASSPATTSVVPVTETPGATPTAATPANQVGIVGIAPSLVGDPRAALVATMLNTYFGGIDDRDYARALGALDPSGAFDPTNPQNRAKFASEDSTTFDRNIEVIGINPGDASLTATTVRVTFQSTQAAGMGPSGQEWETCTNWDLLYTLGGFSDAYLIYHSDSITPPSAC